MLRKQRRVRLAFLLSTSLLTVSSSAAVGRADGGRGPLAKYGLVESPDHRDAVEKAIDLANSMLGREVCPAFRSRWHPPSFRPPLRRFRNDRKTDAPIHGGA
jgi:hypothetical protein